MNPGRRGALAAGLTVAAAACISTIAFAQQPVAQLPGVADSQTYLAEFAKLCKVNWPNNRSVTVVCHGHSVPSGYFKTPEVRSLDAYPNLLRIALAKRYPHAVINVLVTSIGGEQSEQGAARFDRDVLSLHPDVLTIDYALNDRGIGLERAREAWSSMIERAQAAGIKVLLLTPTPDLSANLDDPKDPLNQHAEQIRQLARTYHLGLVDSLAAFKSFIKDGGSLPDVMAQVNHPNAKGHLIVAKELTAWFPK